MGSFKNYNTKKLGAVLIFICILLTPIISVIAYTNDFDRFKGGSHGGCHGTEKDPEGYVSITSSSGSVVDTGETFTLSIQAFDFREAIDKVAASMGFSSLREVSDNSLFTFVPSSYLGVVDVDSSGNTEIFDFVVTAPTIVGSYTLVADILYYDGDLQWAEGSIIIEVQEYEPKPPTFSNLLESSDPIELGKSVIISVDIEDPDGLQPVYIEFNGTQLPMVNISINTYEYKWTPTSMGKIDYTIFANDTTGDSNSLTDSITVLESRYPTFESLLESADPLPLGQNETIFINAFDSPGSGIKQLIIEYENESLIMNNHTMENYFGNTWRWTNWKPSSNGTYNYTIYIEDNVSNWNSTTGNIVVINSEGPIIENVTKIPDPLEFGEEITFQVDVYDNETTVSSVIIELENDNYTMTPVSGNTWEFNWTPSTCGVKYYKIYSNDSVSNWNQINDILLVQDTIAPTFLNLLESTDPAEVGQVVTFQVDVIDLSNITQVLLEINGEIHQGKNISENTYEINWTAASASSYSYNINAIDSEGNFNTTSGFLVVHYYIESQIIIDALDPLNWSNTVNRYDWAHGSGTWIDPYIIENVTIIGDGNTNGIEILNSESPFIIRNCNLDNVNTLGPEGAGIKFFNTSNGRIINSNSTYNYHGIIVENSNNITILNNQVKMNRLNGIYLKSSNYINIFENNISENNEFSSSGGISLTSSNFSDINDNIIYSNENGISLFEKNYYNDISSNLIDKNSHAGVYIENSHNNSIFQNNLTVNNYGIDSENSDYNNITENNIKDNIVGGIILEQTSGFLIENEIHSNGMIGINGSNINSSVFKRNIIYNHSIDGISLSNSYDNQFVENIIYEHDQYGIDIYIGMNNIIFNNSIDGISFSDCDDNKIVENIINDSINGISFIDCDDNKIVENIIYNNNIGIIIEDCINNSIYQNIIFKNTEYGLLLDTGYLVFNDIFFNAFYENGENARDVGPFHIWDNGTIGNYWDDYDGVDLDGDGIGDSIYNIGPMGNVNFDRYPLIESPIHNGEAIHIDGNGISAHNWSYTAFLKFWITGKGTEIDPYIIEDLTIDGEGNESTILIGNSTVYFKIQNNIISNAGGSSNAGVKLENVSNGMIINNYFVGNELNAEDNGINITWDDGKIGNYWDDYEAYDIDGDGIGETPYNVQGIAGSIDRFPIWDIMDDIEPNITINFPNEDDTFGVNPPKFNITIEEYLLSTIWYQVEDGTIVYVTETNGSIDVEIWASTAEGPVKITFFAKDAAGNVGSIEIVINKQLPDYTEIILTAVGASFLIVFLTLSTTMVVHNEKRQTEIVKQQMKRKKIIQ